MEVGRGYEGRRKTGKGTERRKDAQEEEGTNKERETEAAMGK